MSLAAVRRALSISIVTLGLLALPAAAGASPGDPVSSFGSSGFVTQQIGAPSNATTQGATSVVRDANGDLVVVGVGADGSGNPITYVARYLPDGQLDTSFVGSHTTGTPGLVQLTGLAPGTFLGRAVALEPNGDIVVAGGVIPSTSPQEEDFGVLRLDASDGTYVSSFANNAIVADTPMGDATPPSGEADSVLVDQATGDIYLGGKASEGGHTQFALAGYDSSGNLLSAAGAFGTGGKAYSDVSGDDAQISRLAWDGGRIVADGILTNTTNHTWSAAVIRYTAAGAADNTFNNGALYSVQMGSGSSSAYSLLVESNGEVLVAGDGLFSGDDCMALALVNAGGSGLDSSFGSGGVAHVCSGTGAPADAVVSDSDGIYAGGYDADNSGVTRFLLARFTAGGTLDTNFGSDGLVHGSPTGTSQSSMVNDMTLAGTNVVLAGSAANSNAPPANFDMALEEVQGGGSGGFATGSSGGGGSGGGGSTSSGSAGGGTQTVPGTATPPSPAIAPSAAVPPAKQIFCPAGISFYIPKTVDYSAVRHDKGFKLKVVPWQPGWSLTAWVAWHPNTNVDDLVATATATSGAGDLHLDPKLSGPDGSTGESLLSPNAQYEVGLLARAPGCRDLSDTTTVTVTSPSRARSQAPSTLPSPHSVARESGATLRYSEVLAPLLPLQPPTPPPACQSSVRLGLLPVYGSCLKETANGSGVYRTDKTGYDARLRVDGIDFVPSSGGMTVNTKTYSVTGDGPVSIRIGPWVVKRLAAGQEFTFPSLNLGLNVPSGTTIGGFKIKGAGKANGQKHDIELTLGKNGAHGAIAVELPEVFRGTGGSLAGGPTGGLSGQMQFDLDPATGLKIDTFKISVPALQFGFLKVKDFQVSYQSGNQTWNGQGTIVVPLKDAAGEFSQAVELTANLTWQNGQLVEGHADIGGFNRPLTPWLFLQGGGIDFHVGSPPVYFGGHTLLTFGPEFVYNGEEERLGAIKNAGIKYLVPTIAGDLGTFELSGALELGGLQVATATVDYSPGGGAIDGRLNIDFDKFGLKVVGRSGFTLNGETGYLELGSRLQVNAGPFSGVAKVMVDTAGMTACGELFGHPVGGELFWSSQKFLFGANCGFGKSHPAAFTRPKARAADAGDTVQVRVAPGQDRILFGVTGDAGAPGLTAIGPDGKRASIGPDVPNADSGDFLFLRYPAESTTYVTIDHPAAGTWTLETSSGHVVSVVSSGPQVTPTGTGKVTGEKHHRTLEYALQDVDEHEKVTFFERSADVDHEIGVAHGDHGTVDFDPASAPYGQRKIVADVSDGGDVIAELDLTHFEAGQMPLLAAPTVHARRHGHTVDVRWSGLSGAQAYQVTLQYATDHRDTVLVSGRRRAMHVEDFYRDDWIDASVAGIDDDNRVGNWGSDFIDGTGSFLANHTGTTNDLGFIYVTSASQSALG